MKPQLILMSESAGDHEFAKKFADAAGLKLEPVPRDRIADADLKQATTVFVDARRGLDEAYAAALKGVPAQAVHYLCDHAEQTFTNSSCDVSGQTAAHMVLLSGEDLTSAAWLYARVIAATKHGFTPGATLAKILPGQANCESFAVSKSHERKLAPQIARGLVIKSGCHRRRAEAIAHAMDELLINAIYNAPVNEFGSRLRGHVTGADLDFSGRFSIACEVAYDRTYAFFSVTDQFGSLRSNEVFTHVARSYDPGKMSGLGLALIVRAGGSLHFSITPDQRTTAICGFDLLASDSTPKNLQFISVHTDTPPLTPR